MEHQELESLAEKDVKSKWAVIDKIIIMTSLHNSVVMDAQGLLMLMGSDF